MFSGAEGSGNLAIARAFVQYLFCKERSETDSCGQCSNCIKIGKLSHPDVHWVYPVANTAEVKSKAKSDDFASNWRNLLTHNPFLTYTDWVEELEIENKQAQIGVEESGEILRKLSLKAYEGGFRVAVIWLPEKMNISASNKLLKVLEEPPEGVVFILVPESTDAILPTILSRVQFVKISAPSNDEMVNYLLFMPGISHEKALESATLADGNLNKALKLANSEEADPHYATFMAWMRGCYAPNVPELLAWIEIMAKSGRENQKTFLTYSIEATRKFLLMNFRINDLVMLSNAEQSLDPKFINFFPSKIHGGNCMRIVELISDAQYHIERNGNAKIVLIDTSLKISEQLKMTV